MSQSLRMNGQPEMERVTEDLRTDTGGGADRDALAGWMDRLLESGRFSDYGPNGLQVEGRTRVRRIVSGVTASLALIEAAAADGADAIVVHHGLFWRGQDGRVTGWMKRRLAALLAHDISLYAYHLPLDAHPEVGNNARLGAELGLTVAGSFGDKALGLIGAPADGPCSLEALTARVQATLGRAPVVVPGDGRPVRRVAWCTGGAQGYFESAIAAGADVYLTGEISEPQAHIARETGCAFLACGHHATERYGAQALGARVAAEFGLQHRFIDLDNPA
jgi:dinuclear metal center YbgI/SA1388 family protein